MQQDLIKHLRITQYTQMYLESERLRKRIISTDVYGNPTRVLAYANIEFYLDLQNDTLTNP